MPRKNDERDTSRRQLLKTSGRVVTGGLVLGSFTQSASADPDSESDLNLESDFRATSSNQNFNRLFGKTVDAVTQVYQPRPDTEFTPSEIRVVRTVIEFGAGFPWHASAGIQMTGKNDARLLTVGPGNTIPQQSRSYSVSTSAGISGGLPEASVSVSATEGITKSALHIDDKTRPSEHQMAHSYTFDGGLERNHIVIDGTAIFDTGDVNEWDDAIEVNWSVNATTHELSDSFTYTHHTPKTDVYKYRT